jgi:glyoxylase-like metal-dependent hydrolase (beta-lactamase superfamily II)
MMRYLTSVQTVYLKGCTMLISGFAAGPWATNCWVVAPAAGSECIVIDPGMDCIPTLTERLAANSLKPVAILLTHGHIDHMWSVTPIADGYDIPAVIHAADRHLLADPLAGVGEAARQMVEQLKAEFVEPAKVQVVDSDLMLNLAGLEVKIESAPGHTAGSVVFKISDERSRMFSGDVIFKGSIGRTDLPGGSMDAMMKSLREVIAPTPSETIVHCGHGPDTTIGFELKNNPYLREMLRQEV